MLIHLVQYSTYCTSKTITSFDNKTIFKLLPIMFRFLQLYLIQQTSQQNGLLIIRNAQSVNTGEYFCTAINNQGRSVARIVINMIDRPTPFPGGEVQVSIIIMLYRTIITPSNAHTELY